MDARGCHFWDGTVQYLSPFFVFIQFLSIFALFEINPYDEKIHAICCGHTLCPAV